MVVAVNKKKDVIYNIEYEVLCTYYIGDKDAGNLGFSIPREFDFLFEGLEGSVGLEQHDLPQRSPKMEVVQGGTNEGHVCTGSGVGYLFARALPYQPGGIEKVCDVTP